MKDNQKKEEALARIAILEQETANLRKIIESQDECGPIDVMREYKTYEDCCKFAKIKPRTIEDYYYELPEDRDAAYAYHQMTIIFRAINQGRRPNYKDKTEVRYWPWMFLDELASGFGASGYGYSDSSTAVGARLCCFSKEHCRYIGTQFGDIINRLFKY